MRSSSLRSCSSRSPIARRASSSRASAAAAAGRRTVTEPSAITTPNSAISPRKPIDDGGSLYDEPLAHPVQRQQRLLLGALHRHEAHARARHRLANRLGVVAVVLARSEERRVGKEGRSRWSPYH